MSNPTFDSTGDEAFVLVDSRRVFRNVTDFKTHVSHPSLPLDDLISFRSDGKLYHFDHRIVRVEYATPTQAVCYDWSRPPI